MKDQQDSVAVLRELLKSWEADVADAGPLNKKDLRPERFIQDLHTALQSQQVASADRGEAMAWHERVREIAAQLANDGCEGDAADLLDAFAALTPPSPAESAEAVQLLADLNGQIAVLLQRVAIAEAAAAPSGVSDADVERACAEMWPSWKNPNLRNDSDRQTMRRVLEAAQPQPGRVEGMVPDPSWKVLAEHSGCGYGTQVDQITVRVNRGDKVVLIPAPAAGGPS